MMLLYTIAMLIIFGMIIYFLIKLFKIYNNWNKDKNRFKDMTGATDELSSMFKQFQNTGDSFNDDEKYTGDKKDEVVDEYYKFDENIQSIISSYKESSTCKKEGMAGIDEVNRYEFLNPEYD